MNITKKEIETLKIILEKIEDNQKNEKMRITGRRKLQKQGKSLNKRKVPKQTRSKQAKPALRKKPRIGRRSS